VCEYLRARELPGADDPRLERAVGAAQEKISTLAEFTSLVGFAFGPVEIDPVSWDKVMTKDGAKEALALARSSLAEAEPFDEQHVEEALRRVVEELGTKPGKVFQPVRVAITGKTVSAGVFESVSLLGKEEALGRIDSALAKL
jgi:glutamyl-tRNA synthetase